MLLNIRKLAQFTAPYRSKLIIKSYRSWTHEKEKVLDIGCGNGISTKQISENLKVFATGCDIEKNIVASFPFFLIPRSGKLPFKDRTFDAAMLNDVLHHVEKHQQLPILKEALRVAKEVLIFEVEPTLSGKVFDMLLNKLHYKSLKTPLSFRWKKEWIKLFEEVGLKYETKKVKTPFWYPFSNIAMIIKEKNRR